jgi:hypothetical protein
MDAGKIGHRETLLEQAPLCTSAISVEVETVRVTPIQAGHKIVTCYKTRKILVVQAEFELKC